MWKPRLLLAVLAAGFVLAFGWWWTGNDRLYAAVVSSQSRPLTAPHFTVDKVDILDRLRRKDFTSLARTLEDLARQSAADVRAESDFGLALASFSADPALTPLVEAWVEQQPKSAMALLVRAVHLKAIGFARRGDGWASETTDEQFREMHRFFDPATVDARGALVLDPTLVAAYEVLIESAMADGGVAACRQEAAPALAARPASYRLRTRVMECLTPRWGGSYEAMEAFAEESSAVAHENSRVAALRGFVDSEKGNLLEHEKDYIGAIRAYTRALSFGDHHAFYTGRGRALYRTGNWREAVVDLKRAARLSPQSSEVLLAEAYALAWGKQRAEATQAIDLIRKIDPTSRGLASFPFDWLKADPVVAQR